MKYSKGGTLIEVVMAIIIIAIAAAIFISYMGSTYMRSPVSAVLVSDQYKLTEQMEILTSKYRQELEAGGGTIPDLCAFKTAYVDPLNINGVNIVDAAGTSCNYSLTDTTNTYTTAANNALLVTLTYQQQTLQSIFTK